MANKHVKAKAKEKAETVISEVPLPDLLDRLDDPYKRQFIEVYRAQLANMSAACRITRISRQAVYAWLKNDPVFAEVFHDAKEILVDYVESHLLKKIKDGDVRAITFFLETVGKHRGYTRRLEVDHGGDGDQEPEPFVVYVEGRTVDENNYLSSGVDQ